MHEELKERLKPIEINYDAKAFWAIVDRVKKDKINDDDLLEQIESISLKRFRENVSFMLSVVVGNALAVIATVAAIGLAFQKGEWMLYISTLILMTSLHPLSHSITGSILRMKFTHYYLNGSARFEPTLRIDYSSYLKASPERRALMHASGVVGTIAAPLIAMLIALNTGAGDAAFNLFILFLLLVVFELLTSTKTGDLMRAKREYGYR